MGQKENLFPLSFLPLSHVSGAASCAASARHSPTQHCLTAWHPLLPPSAVSSLHSVAASPLDTTPDAQAQRREGKRKEKGIDSLSPLFKGLRVWFYELRNELQKENLLEFFLSIYTKLE